MILRMAQVREYFTFASTIGSRSGEFSGGSLRRGSAGRCRFSPTVDLLRVRLPEHYVYLAIALLFAAEAIMFFAAIYAAVLVRFHGSFESLPDAPDLIGALWPRALLFSLIMLLSLLSFGLYSARQRARLSGLAARLMLAVLMAFGVASALFYLVPYLWIGRGVVGLPRWPRPIPWPGHHPLLHSGRAANHPGALEFPASNAPRRLSASFSTRPPPPSRAIGCDFASPYVQRRSSVSPFQAHRPTAAPRTPHRPPDHPEFGHFPKVLCPKV